MLIDTCFRKFWSKDHKEKKVLHISKLITQQSDNNQIANNNIDIISEESYVNHQGPSNENKTKYIN